LNVGSLTAGIVGTVDEHGTVVVGDARLAWRAHVIDRWVDEISRHDRPGIAPTAETAIRVPGGEAVQRVYAIGDGGVVVEFENASGDAIGIGVDVQGSPALTWSRAPGSVEGDRLVFPLPHRQKLRLVLGGGRDAPDSDAVARGWEAMLERGMRVELPEAEQFAVDRARVDALLAPPSAAAFVALEQWGFDDEAAAMWARMSSKDRRAARKYAADTGVLGEVRAAMLREDGTTIAALPGFRPQWLGRPVAVHHAPSRRGLISFAVRWHGARPALLWEVPAGSVVRVPALDPAWSSTEAAGETLLSEPPNTLLPMGTHEPEGATVDAPESFT
jgi:hypothetical protein